MSIYLWEGKTIVLSDMQWPCPDGFHVPSLQDIYNSGTWLLAVWNWLWLSNTDVKTYFKLPDAWGIYYNDWIAYSRWTNGSYWTSTNSWDTKAIRFYAKNTSVDFKCMWYPIRWFKNTPVEPDSSWTVLYQWTGTAWVYHNPQLWLITASSDGTTWYTIMDKNLWATTVYNYWDTLTDDNCWYYYQRWNNYWFSYTGTRTTSSTIVDASSYWPWNYYSSSTFIINSTNWFWDRPINNNLRWWVTQWTSTKTSTWIKEIYLWEGKKYSDMQWPSPSWFHVPTKSEWEWLISAMSSLWIGDNKSYYKNYLHIPEAWFRDNGWTRNTGNMMYWTCTPSWTYEAYIWYQPWYSIGSTLTRSRTYWYPIRSFKDEFVVPDSNWTVLYWTLWWAWIFYNQTEWIISITTNWTTWYTIADKNLWATTVYNNWDWLSLDNMWWVFQRGNNNCFISDYYTYPTRSSTAVDTTWYWPWNYYSWDTYITSGNDWSSVQNDNLWGWVSQWSWKKSNIKAVYLWWPTELIISDMQWPCPDGFHVPLQSEWQSIKTVGISLWAWTSWWGDNFSTYLKIPYAWHRSRVLEFNYRGSSWYYWSSSDVGPNYAYNLLIDYADIIVDNYNWAVQWCTIRWFKDTPVVPDSNWTVLYQWSWSAWIFHNPTDWLISISSDGTTWYTLMDKNLWATTVYNYWDTLTENNWGKIFQRWNNYWFSWDPSYNTSLISQSSSSVNLTGYWPWNYYESSTWVTNSTLQSSSNTNLRWWVSQWTSTKTIYNKIRPKE